MTPTNKNYHELEKIDFFIAEKVEDSRVDIVGTIVTARLRLKEHAKSQLTTLINNKVTEARIDELEQLFDEMDGSGYPDNCEVVHDHVVQGRINELLKLQANSKGDK